MQRLKHSEKTKAVTAADARAFMQKVEDNFAERNIYAAKVAWVQANFMTVDTMILWRE